MNLDFDDSKRMHHGVTKQERLKILRRFINLVDRKLARQSNAPINRFSLKCKDDLGPAPVIGWITSVLKRRVSELVLHISSCYDWPMSSAIVRCDTMVQDFWESCSVSSTSLKSLTFRFQQIFVEPHKSVSFDTPNLLYLDYSDTLADNYPKANFDSLVEARLDLHMSHDQIEARFSEFDYFKPGKRLVGNATLLFMEFAMLRPSTYLTPLLRSVPAVLGFCCEPIPVYNNLIHLTIKTDQDVEWDSLTALLSNCPNLETLVFEGLLHRDGMKCKSSECLCKPWEEEDIPTCLSSSSVKVLEIYKFGDIYKDEDMDKMMEQVAYFLETMPNLEQLIIHYETSIDEDVEEVLSQFQMVPREGLTKCKIQVISDNLTLSST